MKKEKTELYGATGLGQRFPWKEVPTVLKLGTFFHLQKFVFIFILIVFVNQTKNFQPSLVWLDRQLHSELLPLPGQCSRKGVFTIYDISEILHAILVHKNNSGTPPQCYIWEDIDKSCPRVLKLGMRQKYKYYTQPN